MSFVSDSPWNTRWSLWLLFGSIVISVFWLHACGHCPRAPCSAASQALQLTVSVTLASRNSLAPHMYQVLDYCASQHPVCRSPWVLVLPLRCLRFSWHLVQVEEKSYISGTSSSFQFSPLVRSLLSCMRVKKAWITVAFGRLLNSWNIHLPEALIPFGSSEPQSALTQRDFWHPEWLPCWLMKCII